MTDLGRQNESAVRLLLDVRNVTITYPGRHVRSAYPAIDDISLTIASRETVGVVGESGSGKTTIGRAILGLTPVTSGRVVFDGHDITNAGYQERRRLSSELQVVFQDPYSSLNPTRTIGQTLEETARAQSRGSRTQARERASALLARVGLGADALSRYPSAFSGGQRQRIAIARALIQQPRLVICDEPVSALDLSIQAQILNLLRELQNEFQLSYLFIAHDLAVVRHLSQRIIVLYQGRIMEQGPASIVYGAPAHPYTQALLAATPVPDPEEQRQRRGHRRRLPAGRHETATIGCPFTPRCPFALEICGNARPQLETTPEGVLVACHRWRDLRDGETAVASGQALERMRDPGSRG